MHVLVGGTGSGKTQWAVQASVAAARAEIERVAVDLHVAKLRVTDSDAVPRLERERARIDVERAGLGIAKAQTALETLLVTFEPASGNGRHAHSSG